MNRSHTLRRPATACARNHGFTLMELLVSVTLGAVLVISLAHLTTLFGSQFDRVTEDMDTEVEESLGAVSHAVRLGWLVEKVSDTELQVSDALGDLTTYKLVDGSLIAEKENGDVGVLMDGVASLAFDVGTVQRLREDDPLDTYGTYYEQNISGTPDPVIIAVEGEAYVKKANSPYFNDDDVPGVYMRNDAVALAFTISDVAPPDLSQVEGTDEQLISATLDRIVLPVAHLPALPDLPVATKHPKAAKTKTKNNKSKAKNVKIIEDLLGVGDDPTKLGKVLICHHPPGNPSHSIQLHLKSKAASAHLAHGDHASPTCYDHGGIGDLEIELYEARGMDDARPYGMIIGSTSIDSQSLPLVKYDWLGVDFEDPDTGVTEEYTKGKRTKETGKKAPGKKVPTKASKPATPQKSKAVKAQKGNKTPSKTIDQFEYTGDPALQLYPPTVEVPIDLFAMGAELEPGVPYTIVLRYTGIGLCMIRNVGSPSAAVTGVASSRNGEDDFLRDAFEVPLEFDGMRSYTQANDYDVVVRVTTTIERTDGRTLSSSSIVASQIAVTNPWYGQVAGELPALELEGQ